VWIHKTQRPPLLSSPRKRTLVRLAPSPNPFLGGSVTDRYLESNAENGRESTCKGKAAVKTSHGVFVARLRTKDIELLDTVLERRRRSPPPASQMLSPTSRLATTCNPTVVPQPPCLVRALSGTWSTRVEESGRAAAKAASPFGFISPTLGQLRPRPPFVPHLRVSFAR
jgi:hypothetical protein